MTQKRKAYITRQCAVQGVSVPAGSIVDVSFAELQQIRGALRGEEFDPEKHKDGKPVRIEDGKLTGPGAGPAKTKADK